MCCRCRVDRFEALTLATLEVESVSVSTGKILRSPECIRIPEARWRGVKHGPGMLFTVRWSVISGGG